MKHTEKEIRDLIHEWIIDVNDDKVESPDIYDEYRHIADICSYSIIERPKKLGYDVLTVLWNDLSERVVSHEHEYFSLFYISEYGLGYIRPQSDRAFAAPRKTRKRVTNR